MTEETTPKPTSNAELEHAPEHIQLAVDLIYLLESNDIDPNSALKALEIVASDLKKKIAST